MVWPGSIFRLKDNFKQPFLFPKFYWKPYSFTVLLQTLEMCNPPLIVQTMAAAQVAKS